MTTGTPAAPCSSPPDTLDHSEGDGGKASQATILAGIAEARYSFGQSTEGQPYALPRAGARVARPLRGGRGGLRAELAAAYLARHRTPPTSNALADVLGALEGRCLATDPTTLHLRMADADGVLWVDLGDPDGTAVRLDPHGWQVSVDYPVTFRRTALTGPLPHPVPGGSLAELRDLINVTDAAWPLLVAWLVAALLPDLPHPILALFGEQGTGKSTAAKLIASTVDPSPAQLRTAPREVNDWTVTAAGSWVIALDNISAIPDWFSDAMCRAVTGDGMVRRALYTDDGLSVVSFRRCLILTGIGVDALRGDLAERLLVIDLERIGDRARRLDAELADLWTRAHPRVLGALLDLTAHVRAVLPTIHLDAMPRMADFARVVAAVDAVLGTDSLTTYLGQRDALAADVIDADPVAAAITHLADTLPDDGHWTGSASDLAAALTPTGTNWPKTPRGLASRLTRAAPALRTTGVLVEDAGRGGPTKARQWSISKLAGNNAHHPHDPHHTPLTSENTGERSPRDGEDGEHRTPDAHPTLTPTLTPRHAPDQHEHPHGERGEDRERLSPPLLNPTRTSPCPHSHDVACLDCWNRRRATA